jgi:hypothetical protein
MAADSDRQAMLRQVFEIAGFFAIFPIFASESEALRSFQG